MQQDNQEKINKQDKKEEDVVETNANKVIEEVKETEQPKTKTYYALYISNIVCVPGINLTCDVVSKREADGIMKAFDAGEPIVLVAGKHPAEELNKNNIMSVGCICAIKRISNEADGIKVVTVGEKRIRIVDASIGDYFTVTTETAEEKNAFSEKTILLADELKEVIRRFASERNVPPMIRNALMHEGLAPAELGDSLIHLLSDGDVKVQAELLCELDVEKRLEKLIELAQTLSQKIELKKEIDEKVNSNIQKSQKEMFLREQLHVINEELNGEIDENEEFTNKVKSLGLPKDSEEKVLKEIKRMAKLPFGSPELGYIRNFIETVLELPWKQKTDDNIDIEKARKILDDEHYALEDVKHRILETLAVIKLTKQVNAQIICLVGPPGVGKTSIAKSIANAMGRKYVQVSLGGVNDESVIRGHRRTYVGAMCGRILAGMKQVGTINPVFLLDEIDKMTSDARGDPASALLEVLDPAQNDHFKDSFLELPYDLSQVMFILTANDIHGIPYALRDRMEIIKLRAYTAIEKLQIAKKYLLPKQEKLAGLKEGTVKLADEIILQIINEYTFEGGVRELERRIASVCRKYATFMVTGEKFKDITKDNIEDFVGKDRYAKLDIYEAGKVGEIVGLAVLGDIVGDTLLIEATLVPGTSGIKLTGQPGKAMQESVEQVYTLIKSRAKSWGIPQKLVKDHIIHVHIPQVNGVDGPSAGTAMTTAVVSALTGIPTKHKVALTGEISILGRVLPIGGLRDKLIAADRMGIKLCIIPKANEKDLRDVPQEIKDRMEIKLVTTIDEVLELALQEDIKTYKDAQAKKGLLDDDDTNKEKKSKSGAKK